jgi:hypothetical protein
MATLVEQSIWENGVYQWEKTDIVEGGADGLDNVPIRQLANRTVWLKDALRGFIDVNLVSSSKALSLDDVLQKMVLINADAALIVLTLPDISATLKGLKVHLSAYKVSRQVTVRSALNNIIVGNSVRGNLFLGDGDIIELVWTGDNWIVINFAGNFLTVGKPEFAYTVMPNAVIANGQILNRVDYPRLWEFVSNNNNQILVSDFTWLNSTGYKGFFSTGNNGTTFRVPDLRSMFVRGLDIGAGITYGRNIDQPGGYEADAFKSHSHEYGRTSTENKGQQYESNHLRDDDDRGLWTGPLVKTTEVGGTETRPKNIGLIPLILT